MILIDPRDGNDAKHRVSNYLVSAIRRRGIESDSKRIPYGDMCFEGNGPKGDTLIGFERKSLHDMLDCIQSHRLTAKQIPGMKKMYTFQRFIIFEALWKSDNQGFLMQGYQQGYSWKWVRTAWGYNKGQPVLYSTLYRYLISLQLAGNIIIQTHDLDDTARSLVEYYKYFQKPWKAHTSQQEMAQPTIPSVDPDISLVRQWAHAIDGVGLQYSAEAEHLFASGLELAQSTESEWQSIRGIGPKTAKDIVRQIEGRPKR